MARLQDVRLNAAGRRRSAVFTLTGTIVWDGSDGSRNGGELLVRFLGRDPGEDDLIWNTFQWVAKGGDSRAVDGPGTWTITADGPSRSRFEVRVENTNGPFWRRPFNEDTPGRDEVYAAVVVRDTDGTPISDRVESNVVRGRY